MYNQQQHAPKHGEVFAPAETKACEPTEGEQENENDELNGEVKGIELANGEAGHVFIDAVIKQEEQGKRGDEPKAPGVKHCGDNYSGHKVATLHYPTVFEDGVKMV